ncbi:reverse transcriptase domain-containing protein [Tanacetum coccineum]
MADNRTMKELLQAPTEGYGEAIVIPEINADHFEIKMNLLQLVQASPFHDTFYNGLNDNDQDSLNATAGGNLLSKTTREALNIIENKSKVHYSRNKSNVSRVNSTSRESSSKTDERIDKLADQISTLVEIVTKKVVTPATVKAVEESCVTCGSAHAWYNCPNTDSNQSSVCAAMGAYNQVAPPNRVSNHMAPPGFAPVQNSQNRILKPTYQLIVFKVSTGFPNEFSSYVKANESLMRNMQSQINELRGNFSKQEENLRKNLNNDMRSILGSFFQNQASTSGTLPSNTIPNPKGEMKAITTRSGATLAGPSVPPPSRTKEVDREPETKTDQELTESTNNVPPPVVQPSPDSTNLPPAPISTPKIPEPNPHQPPIPYPSRLNKEKLQGKDDIQIHSFLQMFKKIHFNISFSEALAHMPKFSKTVKDLLTNKEKLLEIANTPVNENCSAVILKKLPEKLGDTGRFLIPCEFYGLESCMALADLGASINLMPLSVWKTLSLLELSTTRMTLELATRTIVVPEGIAEDVFVRVGKFTFPADFVVVDYEVDSRVPLILGRPFLRTAHALVDVHGEKLTLRVGDEELVFNVESASKHPQKHSDNSIHKIDILDTTCEDHVYEVLNFQKSINATSGNPTLTLDPTVESLSPSLTPFGDSDLLLEETDAFLSLDDSIPPGIDDGTYDSEGDILFLKRLLNEDPTPGLPPTPHPVCLINDTEKIKPSIEDPPDLVLKDLPSHLEYVFLEGTSKLPVIIAKDLKREEKEQLLKILMEDDFKPAVQQQRRVNPKIHEVIKAEVIKLLDAGLIYPISDSPWTLLQNYHLRPRLKGLGASWVMSVSIDDLYKTFSKIARPMTHLLEKDTPFVFSDECLASFKFLKKRLTEAPILVSPDWDLPFELMCDASDYAVGAVLGQRKDKYFRPIQYASKTLLDAQTNYTVIEKELLAVVYAFEKFRSYLVLSKTIGTENLAADHLSRLENPYQGDRVGMEINDNFPHESLSMISLNPDNKPPWFADIANYLVGNVLVKGMSSQQKKKFFKDIRHYLWDDPYLF